MITQAMLMAAGLGTRLKPFSDIEPKALLPLLGIPMAQFAVDALLEAGVNKIVANVHHLPEKSRNGLESLELGAAKLHLSDESKLLLGSAGGLRKALTHFGERPFFLVNADVVSSIDLKKLALTHEKLRAERGALLTLALLPRSPTGEAYREIRAEGTDSGLIRELGEAALDRPFFSGAAILEPELLSGLAPDVALDFLKSILRPAVQAKRAGYFMTTGIWQDIGSPELWWKAHLTMLELLEVGGMPRMWRKRIEKVNHRIAPRVWSSKMNPAPVFKPSQFHAPTYWHGGGKAEPHAPVSLGPSAVLYGEVPQSPLTAGIGFGGVWHPGA